MIDFADCEMFDISPLISPSTPVFPGDVAFSRQVSMNIEKGDTITLSSMISTMHIGAHVDAPNHYHKGGQGIDQRNLNYYIGKAQVIDLSEEPNISHLIFWKSIAAEKIQARRVLFKTKSFCHKGPWSSDFVSLAAETLSHLADLGVITVGIDTPSIDPATSKTLEAHKMIFEKDMAIIEGINLDFVEPGIYNLIALPLNLENADASPVRAVLVR
jgi:arylformamidase